MLIDAVGPDEQVPFDVPGRRLHGDATAGHRESGDVARGGRASRRADRIEERTVDGGTQGDHGRAAEHLGRWHFSAAGPFRPVAGPRRRSGHTREPAPRQRRSTRGALRLRSARAAARKPSSRGDAARSKMRTVHPACRRAIAADKPPIPAPTINARGMTGCGSLVRLSHWPFGHPIGLDSNGARHYNFACSFLSPVRQEHHAPIHARRRGCSGRSQ